MFAKQLSQNMTKVETDVMDATDVRDEVSNYLKDKGIMRKWLAKKLEVSNSHLTLIFQKERDLAQKHLIKINELFGTSF